MLTSLKILLSQNKKFYFVGVDGNYTDIPKSLNFFKKEGFNLKTTNLVTPSFELHMNGVGCAWLFDTEKKRDFFLYMFEESLKEDVD